jgi:hypothetical protein
MSGPCVLTWALNGEQVACRDAPQAPSISTCPYPSRNVILLVGGSGGVIDWQDYMGPILARNGFGALTTPGT